MEDSDGLDGSGYNFDEIKTGIGDGDRSLLSSII
jgi:hypothetical protein